MFDYLEYTGGVLCCESASLIDIGDKYRTPVFVYSKHRIVENYQAYENTFKEHSVQNFQISYAMKANDNLTILNLLKSLGSGIDAVSIREVQKAIFAGFDSEKIVFSGVGKTRNDIAFAIEHKIGQINVESYEEFLLVCDVAKSANCVANVAIRINPDIDAKTHAKITTGKKSNKFGVSLEVVDRIVSDFKSSGFSDCVCFKGFSVHVGSQIVDLFVFEEMMAFLRDLYIKYDNKFATVDFGGGVGIKYKDSDEVIKPNEYVGLIKKYFGDFSGKIIVEPGRSIVGDAGIFLSKVVRVKNTKEKKIIVMDGGMNNFIRPAFYGAYHKPMTVLQSAHGVGVQKYTIVGPICESSDVFISDVSLGDVKEGDFIVFLSSGAYCRTMASNYNLNDIAGEILIDGDKIIEIRKPVSCMDLIGFEILN